MDLEDLTDRMNNNYLKELTVPEASAIWVANKALRNIGVVNLSGKLVDRCFGCGPGDSFWDSNSRYVKLLSNNIYHFNGFLLSER